MTWLLQKLQKILGLLTKGKSGAQVSESTQLGSEIASRLQQSSSSSRSDDPVAIRVHGKLLEPVLPSQPAAPQSTAPLRKKNSSALKDTVDPVADEPDTHQRLDAAPASLPGGTLEAPSFPTNVSELLSSPPAPPSAPNGDMLDSTSVSSVEPPLSDDQLPDIHDLLPAVEPDPPSDTHDTIESVSGVSEQTPIAESSSEASDVIHSDSLVVESAQRVSAAEQATLFSFDIIEADTAVEASSVEPVTVDNGSANQNLAIDSTLVDAPIDEDEIDGDRASEGELVNSEAVDIEPADIELSDEAITDEADAAAVVQDIESTDALVSTPMSQSSVVDLPIVSSLIPDTLLSDLSVQEAPRSQLNTETADTEKTTDAKSDEAVVPSVSKEAIELPSSDELSSSDAQNPWLTAVPAQKQNRSSSIPQEILTKNGTVKLLFKLKEGNFHGYITPDDGSKDILFHQKYINAEIFEYIERGTPVVVNAQYREGKAYATRVDLLQK